MSFGETHGSQDWITRLSQSRSAIATVLLEMPDQLRKTFTSDASQFPSSVLIHSEKLHGRARDNCYTNDLSITQPEVFFPIIQPRMKQAREFAGLWVDAGKVRAFVEIAVMTGERQILGRVFSFVLPCTMCST
jgi:hypothetical protein